MMQVGLIGLFFLLAACSSLNQVAVEGDASKARALIIDGQDVNERGQDGITPLMVSAGNNHVDLIELLISNGADINLTDKVGKNALQHAFEAGSNKAFMLLLDNGADSGFLFDKASSEFSSQQRKMLQAAQEHRWYKKIDATGNVDVIRSYFIQYPDGVYTSAVNRVLKRMIQQDYKAIDDATSADQIHGFIERYSGIGNNCVTIKASALNIRNRPATTDSDVSGMYYRGDRACFIQAENGWLRTDRGWIDGRYTEPAGGEIPLIAPYINNARLKLDRLNDRRSDLSAPAMNVKKPSVQKASHVSQKGEETLKSNSSDDKHAFEAKERPLPKPVKSVAERELDKILLNPNLSDLESYIRKYQNDRNAQHLVKRAKQRYKNLLLGK